MGGIAGVIFRNVNVSIYTDGQALTLIPGHVVEFADPEDPNNNSPISTQYKILVEILCAIPSLVGAQVAGPIGAVGGIVVGATAKNLVFHIAQGTQFKPLSEGSGNATHAFIDYGDNALVVGLGGGNGTSSVTDGHLLFVKLQKNQGLRCGLVKVVIAGEIVTWSILPGPVVVEYSMPYQSTIYFPWFISD